MNWVDIIIIIIIAGSLTYSLIKGFVKETFFLGGILAGLLAALKGYSYAARVLDRLLDNPALANVLSFLIILAAVFVGLRIIGWFVEKAFKSAGLSALDRTLGAILGAVKGVVIASVLLLMLVGFTQEGKRYVADSRLSPRLLKLSGVMSKALPEKVRDGFWKTYDNLQDARRLKGIAGSLGGKNKK